MQLLKTATARGVAIQRLLTVFLQAVIILIGIGVLVFLIVEPQREGVNVHATNLEIYFDDLFLLYAYSASIPFFIALYQAFALLRSFGRNTTFSHSSVMALRMIQCCALAIIVFIAAPTSYLFIAHPGDDIAGGVAMGLFVMFVSLVVTAAAAALERMLRNGMRKPLSA